MPLTHSLQQKLDQSRWPLPSLDHTRKRSRDKGTLGVFSQLEMTRKGPLTRHRKGEASEETELDPQRPLLPVQASRPTLDRSARKVHS